MQNGCWQIVYLEYHGPGEGKGVKQCPIAGYASLEVWVGSIQDEVQGSFVGFWVGTYGDGDAQK